MNNVRVVKPGEDFRFLPLAGYLPCVGAGLRKDLDRYEPSQRFLPRLVDNARSARASCSRNSYPGSSSESMRLSEPVAS